MSEVGNAQFWNRDATKLRGCLVAPVQNVSHLRDAFLAVDVLTCAKMHAKHQKCFLLQQNTCDDIFSDSRG